MKEGISTKIHSDIVIGGDTQMQTAKNYIRVLNKLDLANLCVEPQKVIIFPESADIAGCIWEKGGMLSVSPHRKNSLTNMREHNITKVKHLHSFLGLYKTLQMATPGVSPSPPSPRRGCCWQKLKRSASLYTLTISKIQGSKKSY